MPELTMTRRILLNVNDDNLDFVFLGADIRLGKTTADYSSARVIAVGDTTIIVESHTTYLIRI